MSLAFPAPRLARSDAAPSRASDAAHAVLALIVIGSLVRIAMAGVLGLGIDESYTVANARFVAWSYVDYPPLHAWLVAVWVWLAGSDNALIVRLPFIGLFAGSTWMMFRLGAMLFGERAGVWAALLLNLAPVFALPHGSWVLPDGPLTFFLLSAVTLAAQLLFENGEPSRDLRGWLGVGLLGGLAMLSKYHGAFFLLGMLAFLLSWPPGRRLLATPAPWLGAAVAIALFVPVIVWNVQHDWIGLWFQAKRIPGTGGLSLSRVVTNIAGQALYLSPWLLIPLAAVWVQALRRGAADPRSWLLALLAGGPIVFFTAANLFARGLPHWAMPGWLFVFPLLGAAAAKLELSQPRLVRIAAQSSAAILAVLFVVVAGTAVTGWPSRVLPARAAQSDPTLQLLDWRQMRAALDERGLRNDKTVVAGLSWIDAGKLNYALGRDVPVLCLCTDPQEFRFLQDPSRYSGRDILIVQQSSKSARSPPALLRHFRRVQVLAPIVLTRAGAPALQLNLSRGIGFQP